MVSLIVLLPGCIRTKQKGAALAQRHCSSCHQFADPALLDKTTWQRGVLPVMGLHLGRLDADTTATENLSQLLVEGNYPRQAVVTTEQWEKIKAFYASYAPDTLPASGQTTPLAYTDVFAVRQAALPHISSPGVTCVKIDSVNRQVYAADASNRALYVLDASGKLQQTLPQQTAISAIHLTGGDSLLTAHIGFSIHPTESHAGYARGLALSQPGTASSGFLLNELHRPTQVLPVDLDNDQVDELLVCNYGYRTGSLAYWKKSPNGAYQEYILKAEPGALKAEIGDFTGDGLVDLLVLFAQGDEKLVLWENQGNGDFKERLLLRFPPVYGSTYFEIQDFNRDGLPDVLYTCGDNADYSMTLKPYHGVYVFLNRGGWQLEQAYFFPMAGTYKAIARDFDNDGDLDIAAIAFFADYAQHPERSFVYLENTGTLAFSPATLPIHTLGRWMTMDAADIDGDGDEDIALGSYTIAPNFMQSPETWKDKTGVVFLINTSGGVYPKAQPVMPVCQTTADQE